MLSQIGWSNKASEEQAFKLRREGNKPGRGGWRCFRQRQRQIQSRLSGREAGTGSARVGGQDRGEVVQVGRNQDFHGIGIILPFHLMLSGVGLS